MDNTKLLETIFDILASKPVAPERLEEVTNRLYKINYDVHEIEFDDGKIILALADLRGE